MPSHCFYFLASNFTTGFLVIEGTEESESLAGNFSRRPSVTIMRESHEGLFHKLADENLASARRARAADSLPGGPSRGTGGGPRGCAGSRANGAERDLSSDLKIGLLRQEFTAPRRSWYLRAWDKPARILRSTQPRASTENSRKPPPPENPRPEA